MINEEKLKSGLLWVSIFALFFLMTTGYLVWKIIQQPAPIREMPTNLTVQQILNKKFNANTMFTPVPDPIVNITFFPNLQEEITWSTEVPLTTNASGMRYPSEFSKKKPGTYRVIILGDSFYAAHASRYEDGIAPQLEAMLNRALDRTKLDRTIEVYPIAVSGWNIYSALAYMTNNEHFFTPDLVIQGINRNDFDNAYGFIMGNLRTAVYDNQRVFGRSYKSIISPHLVLGKATNALGLIGSYLIPESRERYHEATKMAQRLQQLLIAKKGRYLINVIDPFVAYGVKQAFSQFMDERDFAINPHQGIAQNNLLPLDGHPNKEGYRYWSLVLAHFILDRKVLPLKKEVLQKEGHYYPYATYQNHPVNEQATKALFQTEKIPAKITFKNNRLLIPGTERAVVGGLHRGGILSPSTTLVLARKDEKILNLTLYFPAVLRLKGSHLNIFINGQRHKVMVVPVKKEVVINMALKKSIPDHSLIEIRLENDAYYTEPYQYLKEGIVGGAPRSGRLLSVWLSD